MTLLKTEGLSKKTEFSLRPDADARRALAAALGISGIRKLLFAGQIAPEGSKDLRLTASLGATVVQPCVVTLDPVSTRIDTDVTRLYLADLPELPDSEEIEMPEDDTIEPLREVLDLSEVMAEALALELPEWPRAEGVEPLEITVTEPGKTPMTDEDAKPFAGLAGLREKLEKKGD